MGTQWQEAVWRGPGGCSGASVPAHPCWRNGPASTAVLAGFPEPLLQLGNSHCNPHCNSQCGSHCNSQCNSHCDSQCNSLSSSHCDSLCNSQCDSHCDSPCKPQQDLRTGPAGPSGSTGFISALAGPVAGASPEG